MNISAQEEELFKRWETTPQKRNDFVRDGVISEKEYQESNIKIVMILKEVNDPGGGGWDLRKFIAEGARSQTWDNVARWVDGVRKIKDGRSIPKWKDFPHDPKEREQFRKDTLKSICSVNLKKSPGTHTANSESLWAVATEDKDFIQEQYKIYEPDLTICGGTGDLFRSVMEHENKEWQQTSRDIWWYERAENKYVVGFSHPEARVQSALLVYGLLDAVNEIMGNQCQS